MIVRLWNIIVRHHPPVADASRVSQNLIRAIHHLSLCLRSRRHHHDHTSKSSQVCIPCRADVSLSLEYPSAFATGTKKMYGLSYVKCPCRFPNLLMLLRDYFFCPVAYRFVQSRASFSKPTLSALYCSAIFASTASSGSGSAVMSALHSSHSPASAPVLVGYKMTYL